MNYLGHKTFVRSWRHSKIRSSSMKTTQSISIHDDSYSPGSGNSSARESGAIWKPRKVASKELSPAFPACSRALFLPPCSPSQHYSIYPGEAFSPALPPDGAQKGVEFSDLASSVEVKRGCKMGCREKWSEKCQTLIVKILLLVFFFVAMFPRISMNIVQCCQNLFIIFTVSNLPSQGCVGNGE